MGAEHPREDEIPQVGDILTRAFNFPVDQVPEVVDRVGLDNFRVSRREGVVDGVLSIVPMGQWFGCRRVPMAGIGGVAVAAEARGRGVSTRLLRATAEELRGRGFALSVLFPTAYPVYRKVGYEVAGSGFEARVETSRIHVSVRADRLRPLGLEERAQARLVYGQIASNRNGWLDRGEYSWHRVFEPRGQEAFGYLVGDAEDPEGYMVAYHKGSDLQVTDLHARTAAAADQLLTLMADHRSTVGHVRWRSSGFDAVMMRLPDKVAELTVQNQWMMRILDVPAALRRRGYPVGIDAELHLEVHGDDLAANNGRFVLRAKDGKASVEPGGRGDMKLSVRALAPLYTGFMTPWVMRDGEMLEAEPPALTAAATLFGGGGLPTMVDYY